MISVALDQENGVYTRIQHPSGQWIERIDAITKIRVIDNTIHIKLLGEPEWFIWPSWICPDDHFIKSLHLAIEANMMALQKN